MQASSLPWTPDSRNLLIWNSAQDLFELSGRHAQRLDLPSGRRPLALFLTAILWVVLMGLPFATPADQDLLVTNIDRSVSPRDDFFQYANGAWLRQHPIPEDQTRWGIGNVVSDELYSQLRRLSEQVAAKPARRGSAEQLIGDFWATGMDRARLRQRRKALRCRRQ